MVNPEIRLNVDVTASRAGFWFGNELFCCGSRFCVQLRVEQPRPAQGPFLDASLINPHPLLAPLCLHRRVTFLMPRTCAAIYLSSPPKDCEGPCQIFNCIFLADSHSLVLRKISQVFLALKSVKSVSEQSWEVQLELPLLNCGVMPLSHGEGEKYPGCWGRGRDKRSRQTSPGLREELKRPWGWNSCLGCAGPAMCPFAGEKCSGPALLLLAGAERWRHDFFDCL